MNKGNMSRRGFLGRTLTGLTVGFGLPAWFARDLVAEAQERQQPAQPGAGDRLVMGAIGTGTNYFRVRQGEQVRGERGIAIMQDAMRQRGVQMVAVCDVDRHNRDFGANIVGRDCRKYDDFRELLANRDINAVTIGTPDHWHALVAIAAMRAGKHVYCEKPLTLTIDEGKAMVRVQRHTGRILQTGSQQRSDARFRLACELVRNGRIGRVQRVETRIGSNPVGGPFRVQEIPRGLNWDFWLGQTPRVDFVKERCHYEFRWWYEYSGGKMTDWGAHHNDIAQWGLGMDASGPVQIEVARATAPSRMANSYNCHPNFEVRYTYANGPGGANGTVLVCKSDGENGVRFEGEDGKAIFVSRGRIAGYRGTTEDRRLIEEPLAQGATRLPVSTNHMGNFIACVRNRQQPICNVNVGHRSVTVCHLGNIAIRTGRRLRWDPREERFTGEHAEEGNRMLTRPMRAPWAEFFRQQVGTA